MPGHAAKARRRSRSPCATSSRLWSSLTEAEQHDEEVHALLVAAQVEQRQNCTNQEQGARRDLQRISMQAWREGRSPDAGGNGDLIP